MAQSIESFLRKNVRDVEETKKVKFDRFNAPFIIKTVSEKDNAVLRKQATRHATNRQGQVVERTDTNQYIDNLVLASLVSPDPNDSQLQSSWGTPGLPAETLKAMLHAGEYAELADQIQKLSGFETDSVDKLVDDVKN